MAKYVSNFNVLGENIAVKDEAAQSDLTQIKETIPTIQEDITNLDTITNKNSSNINTLKLTMLGGKNIVFFGDSWTVGSGASSYNLGFANLMANRLGMRKFNYAVGGAGFLRTGNLISSQLTTAKSDMSQTEKNETSIVFILGGVNDWRNQTGSISEMNTAIKSLCDSCHSTFTNAKIVIALCNTENLSMTDTFRNWMYNFRENLIANCNYPIQIIKNIENVISGRPNCYVSDNLHPSTYGHSILAGFFINQLLGGSSDVCYYHSLISLNAGFSFSSIQHFFRYNENVRSTRCVITSTKPITSNTKIGTFSTLIAPKDTIYFPTYYGNRLVGNIGITNSGNVYLSTLNSETSISTFTVPDFSYVFGQND